MTPFLGSQIDSAVALAWQCGIRLDELVREFRRRYLVTVLEHCDGNAGDAAKKLGMHRNSISRQVHELHIDVRPMRARARARRRLLRRA